LGRKSPGWLNFLIVVARRGNYLSTPAGTMCSMWSHYHRGSPSKCAQQENERESIGICNDESGLMPSLSSGTHPSAATQQASTGKAEYSERGPLSLREHGGETYSGQPEHRRSTLTPHRPRRLSEPPSEEDSRRTLS